MTSTTESTKRNSVQGHSGSSDAGHLVLGPIISPELNPAAVTDLVAGIVEKRRLTPGFLLLLGGALTLLLMLFVAIVALFWNGVGIWGIDMPVAWGFAIVNFVWWIGIGHAGTLISAFLLLMYQDWRASINRFAEAMTVFAVACAGLFPLLHLGRPWLFYYLLPYPDTMQLWPQWRSALVWDVFAVSTYATVSVLFWILGLVPDMAVMRDRATTQWGRLFYGLGAMGWRNSLRHWRRYEKAYLLLAGLATPLVISVHSVVSFDFAIAVVPGWHSTIFPPYFVAGAIFSGFAMVVTLAIPLRRIFKLQALITTRHLENMALFMLTTGLFVDYGYFMEHFGAWYNADRFDTFMTLNRMFGPYWYIYWGVIFCNIVVTQSLWLKTVRRSEVLLFCAAILVNIGMWLERFMIVVTSLHRDFLPSSWGMYTPTVWDWATYIGTFGLFFTAFILFIRWLPSLAITECRALSARESESAHES